MMLLLFFIIFVLHGLLGEMSMFGCCRRRRRKGHVTWIQRRFECRRKDMSSSPRDGKKGRRGRAHIGRRCIEHHSAIIATVNACCGCQWSASWCHGGACGISDTHTWRTSTWRGGCWVIWRSSCHGVHVASGARRCGCTSRVPRIAGVICHSFSSTTYQRIPFSFFVFLISDT